jgi:hypothetical protein
MSDPGRAGAPSLTRGWRPGRHVLPGGMLLPTRRAAQRGVGPHA